MKIQVCDLSKFVTEDILKAEFGKFGTVASATVVMDKVTGQSKRFGFVEMPDPAAGKAAIRALHHTKLMKVKIRVKEAGVQANPVRASGNKNNDKGWRNAKA